jgi:hypothetical protein
MSQVSVGDWVRFYRDGVLVIGRVEYVKIDPVLHESEYMTDRGSISKDSILEVRKP